MPFPNPPSKIVPFNSGPVAPHDIGRQFDEHARAFTNLINFLRSVLRDDGVARMSAEVLEFPGSRAGVQPDLPTGALGPKRRRQVRRRHARRGRRRRGLRSSVH